MQICSCKQKFHWLISPQSGIIYHPKSTIVEIPLAYQPVLFFKTQKSHIYNTRNSIGLLACAPSPSAIDLSTIVEIPLAYQPRIADAKVVPRSTIVEIPLAYQPQCILVYRPIDLQQQKFHWLISPKQLKNLKPTSTIVEIPLAYQP